MRRGGLKRNCKLGCFSGALGLWVPHFPSRDAQDSRILLCSPQNALGAVCLHGGFPGGAVVKNPAAVLEMQVPSLGWEDPLEWKMALHSSKILWAEELGRLQSMGLQ